MDIIKRLRSEETIGKSEKVSCDNLEVFQHVYCTKPVKVPIHVREILIVDQFPKTQEEREDMAYVSYAFFAAILIYALVCTWLNIAHTVGVLSIYMTKTGKEP